MAHQLTFDLPSKPALGRDAFFVSEANAKAVAQIDTWANWPNRKMMIIGPAGSGKTHLAQVWATASEAQFTTVADSLPPEGANIVIDGADTWRGETCEQALFHLHNHVLAHGGSLLLTASQAPKQWSTNLPDLASRMQAIPTVHLSPPDDALLAALLVKLFDDRQIAISPSLVAYIVPRMTRSTAAAMALVDALDKAALSEGRPITRRLAARLLDNTPGNGIE